MLHRDSRFWDVIAKRREENMKKLAEMEKRGGTKDEANVDEPLSGPTVGRRREFPPSKQSPDAIDETSGNDVSDGPKANTTTILNSRISINAFSIGEDFGIGLDFPSRNPTPSCEAFNPAEVPPSPTSPKKPDALMEALLGLEEDGLEGDEEVDLIHTPLPPTSSVESKVVSVSGSVSTPLAVETKSSSVSAEANIRIAIPKSDGEAKEDKADTDGRNVDADTTRTTNVGNEGKYPPGSNQNESILSDFADDLANLNVVDDADGIDLDIGDFDGFDDFEEDDAELEDLENFLTQVSSTK
jgi:hypothetical protein